MMFNELCVGAVFRRDGSVYMKTNNVNGHYSAVNLKTGYVVPMAWDELVEEL